MTPNSLKEVFRERWEAVNGEFIISSSEVDSTDALVRWLIEQKLTGVVLGGAPLSPNYARRLAQSVELLADFGSGNCKPEAAIDVCAKANVGVTGADALISDTGTLVIGSRRPGDRLVSSLPPVHVAVITNVELYPDLESFLEICDKTVSYTFITGPSRTADIEKQLVLGAHGPLRAIIWDA